MMERSSAEHYGEKKKKNTMEKNMEVPQKNKNQNYHMTWRRQWQPTPVFLPGESHEQAGYSPWGHKS